MARGVDDPTPGLLLVDKPAGWTSHDVVARARRILGTRKVGHAGTLDPMATGLLVLGVGRATRLLTYVTGHDKAYLATIRLGQATITDDAEGEITASADASGISDADITAGIAALTGEIMQRPSAVSAIKVDGKRSYARVRSGEDVELPARPVTVSAFEVLQIRREGNVTDVDVTVKVSSGTYIRALARDLGESFGVGGHLTALRRTRVGSFDVSQAVVLDNPEAQPTLLPLNAAAAGALPAFDVSDEEAVRLGLGQALEGRGAELTSPKHDDDHSHDAVALTDGGMAIAIVRRRGSKARPVIVFSPSGGM